MQEADEFLMRYHKGGAERDKALNDIRAIGGLGTLQQKLGQQLGGELDKNGLSWKLDLADGVYSNRQKHRDITDKRGQIRDIDISENYAFGLAQKLSGKIEGIKARYKIEEAAFFNDMKFLLINAGIVGAGALGLGALGLSLTVGGYALAQGGLSPGLTLLLSHLGTAGGFIASQWSNLFGKKQ